MLISFKPCSVYNNYACLGRSVHIPVLLEYVSMECCVNHMRSISEFICQSYESVSESAQLWNPMEHTVPCSVSSNVRYHKIFYTWLTPCFHFILIVALLTVHSCETQSIQQRRNGRNASNCFSKNPITILQKEREVLNSLAETDISFWFSTEVWTRVYVLPFLWYYFCADLAKIIQVFNIARLDFSFVVKHMQKLIREAADPQGEKRQPRVSMLIAYPSTMMFRVTSESQYRSEDITPSVSQYFCATSHSGQFKGMTAEWTWKLKFLFSGDTR